MRGTNPVPTQLMKSDHSHPEGWNDTQRDYPAGRCIHQLFEDHAERTPDAIALVCGQQELTYRELNQRANELAGRLRGLGVGPNVLVGIYLHRCVELIVGMLATLKAGGAYVPLDPAYPQKRIAAMLDDVDLKVLLTRQSLLPGLPEHRATAVCLDQEWNGAIQATATATAPRPDHLAYVIFTSGSTGKAKAAGVFHHGWMNLMHWFVNEFDVQPSDKVLIISSFSFDITQRSIVMPLIRGAQLHLLASESYDLTLIHRTVFEKKITLLNCAPSAFYPLVETLKEPPTEKLRSLRILFLGGEAISAGRLKKWIESPGCSTEVANVYGAAECTDVSTFYRLRDYQRYCASSVPAGKPIFNTQVYLLNEELEPVPFGSMGEICIAGEGVGMGYINDSALTAQKFVENPFSEIPGDRLYRTGDLARFLDDGNLEFVGRVDHQAKVRGQRIDLGDIESSIRQHPDVKEAVALTIQGRNGDHSVTAYIVPKQPGTPHEELGQQVKGFLRERLPDYMVPSEFQFLKELPLSPNGKADRNALRGLSSAAGQGANARPAGPWSREVRRRRYTLRTLDCSTKKPFEEKWTVVNSLAAGMPEHGVVQYFEMQPQIFQQYDCCVVAFENSSGRTLGLLGGRWFDVHGEPYFYLWTALIVDTHRGMGLFADMLLMMVQDVARVVGDGPANIVLKTYSPSVYQSFAAFGDIPGTKLYPRIPITEHDPVLVNMARKFLEVAYPNLTFDAESAMVPGGQASVGIKVFPRMPKCTTPAIQEYFEAHLTPADQILCVLWVPPGLFPHITEIVQQRTERLLHARNR